jgi:hypothetical protein
VSTPACAREVRRAHLSHGRLSGHEVGILAQHGAQDVPALLDRTARQPLVGLLNPREA